VFPNAKTLKKYVIKHGMQDDYVRETFKEIEPVENVLYSIKHTIASICAAIKADEYHIYLSKGECFRHKQATIIKYKGNRDDTPRPVHYAAARKYIQDYHPHTICTRLEADDALAVYQNKDTVICSIDKDLLQIPGKHYNWVRNEKINVLPRAGLCRKWEQVLIGDGTDNIPGIRNLGPVTAKKMIGDCKTEYDMRKVCLRAWTEALKNGMVKVAEPEDFKHLTPEQVMNEILMLVTIGDPENGNKKAVKDSEEQGDGSTKERPEE
jgi:hypothetical protein